MSRPWKIVAALFVCLARTPPWASASTAPTESSETQPATDAEEGKNENPSQPKPSTLVEKVAVSATRAEERRDAVPFSTVTRERIEETNRGQDLAMLLSDTPNAYAYSDAGNGVGYSYLSVRGFRQEKVATYVDGVPLNTPESHAVYFIDLADLAGDLEAFQVQRGPGTALYGNPAFGGAVSLESRHLDTVEGGELQLGAGSFGTWRAAFRYGGPLAGGRWAWMVRAAHVASDGYREPSWTRHSLFQLGLERFGERSVLRIRLLGGPENTQLAYYGVPIEYLRGEISGDADRDRRVNLMRPGETDTFLQPQLHVLHDLRVNDRMLLQNTLFGIVNRGYYMQYDWEAGVWQKRWIGGHQIGWVPRISVDHVLGTFSAGLFAQVHTMRHEGTVEGETPAVLYDYRNGKTTTSAFVREALRPAKSVVATLELQATRHAFEMGTDRAGQPSARPVYSFVSPRAGVNWNVTDRFNLWANFGNGTSEPTFNAVWNPESEDPASRFRTYDASRGRYEDPLVAAEKLRQVEAGFGFRDGATHVKLGVYRLDARDELVPQGGLDADGLPITVNAGRTLHRGLEIEAATRLPGEVDVAAYVGSSRDILEDLVLFSDVPENPVAVDYSGNRIASFPAHTARLRVARRFGLARIEVGARATGTIFTDNSEDERKNPEARLAPGYVPKRIDPFTVCDARASFDLTRLVGGERSLRLDVTIDNLLDERYVAMGYSYPTNGDFTEFYTEFFPAATRSAFVGLTLGF